MTRSAPPSVGRILLPALLVCLLAAAWYGQHQLQYGSPREVGACILALAIAGALVVLLRADRGGAEHRSPALPDLSRGAEWLAAGTLVGLGILFRFVHFSTIPEGMNHDAAWYGMYAIYITGGAPYTPYTAAGFGRETLFMYIAAPFVHWLGNTPEALQLASTLCGVAALVPLYLLARTMFGARAALIALAFLAVSGWHGVFSRVGWRVITVPPLEMLALYAAWRAVQTGRWRAWLLMGAGAALSVYTYNAARIVPVLALLPYLLFFPTRQVLRRRYLLGGVVALAAFLAVGSPMLYYASTHLDEFQRRVSAISEQRQEEGRTLLANAWDALRLFNYRGNGDDFFVDEPLLEPLAAVLFLVGIAVALRRARQRPYAFLLLGLPIALLPGVLSVPNGNRAIAAIPFVYLSIAVGLDALVTQAAAVFPRRRQAALYAAALTIVVGAAGFESYVEFLSAQRRPMRGFSPGATGAALFMRRHMPQYAPYTVSAWADNTFLYLTYPGSGSPFEIGWPFGSTLGDIEGEIDRRGSTGLMFVLDFSPAADAALAELEQRFPVHRVEAIPPPRGEGAPVARALLVDAGAVAGTWRNFGRALSVRRQAGAPAAGALRCGRPLGDSRGVSARVSLMLPEVDEPMPLAHIAFWSHCLRGDTEFPLVTIAVNGSGLIAETDHDATLVPWAELEAGRWYDVYVAVDAGDRTARIRVEGAGPRARASLPIAAGAVLEVSGVELRTEAPRERGVAIYLDDLTVVGGVLEPADALWSEARGPRPTSGGGVPPEAERRDGPVALHEDFEALAPGSISGTPGWRAIRGSVAVVDSPRSAPVHESAAAASGTDAPAGGEFDEPMGIAVDPEGNFYVTERLGNRVQKFARDGTYLTQWGGRGDGPGQFNEPLDAVADDECLYVVDSWNHRVQAFDWDGGHRFDIRGDDPPLYGPRGIDARHGKIFLIDSGHGMVRVFDRAGQQLTTMGENGGDAPGHLSQPVDVAVGAAGRVYVVNSGNNRIEIFGPDGGVAGSFPISGWEGTDLKEGYLATDADGFIYLSDPVSGRVRRFTTDGVELTALPDVVDLPAGLEADEQHLIVGERLANRVRVIDIPSR